MFSWLSLRNRAWGFSPATINRTIPYLAINGKQDQKNFLGVQFLAYLRRKCPIEISFSCDIYIYCNRISWVHRIHDTYIYIYGRSGNHHFNYHFCGVYDKFFDTVFFLQNTSCIRKLKVMSEMGGGVHPLHPPPRSIPVGLDNSQDLKITEEWSLSRQMAKRSFDSDDHIKWLS